MLTLSVPWWEFVVRALVVYAFLLVFLRVTGRRQVGQYAPFDLVLLLILSNAVQNSMNAGDNSLTGGLISATVLVTLNWLLNFVTFRSKKLADLVEGRSQLLIHNGVVYEDVLVAAKITRHELNAALRGGGYLSVEDVHTAVLETNGSISFTPRIAKKQEAEGRTSASTSSPV